jgi:Htaa
MIPRALVLAALAAAAAVPSTASAASGTSVLTLKGAAASSLSSAGMKVSAVAPATAKGKAITLPVKSLTVGATAALGHSGAIRLKKGSRTLTLKTPALRLAASGSRLTVRLGGKTTTILTVDAAKRSLNGAAGTAALKGARVTLTTAGAAAIRRALKLKALKGGTLGTLTVDASRGSTGTAGGGSGTGGSNSTGGGSTGGGATGGGATGGGSGSGGTGGGGGAQSCSSGPVATPSGGPSALTAPPTSVPVAAASITWHVRDSFIQYINTGEGTAVANGATADPPSVQPGSSASLAYGFHFPFKSGWYDPASNTTRLTYSGTVLFCYFDHGIKLTASNPEIEITSSGARGVFVTGNVDTPDRRGVLVNLENVARADDGATHTWSQMPGRIPADTGDSTFAGYYAAGDPFGWITVSATTP